MTIKSDNKPILIAEVTNELHRHLKNEIQDILEMHGHELTEEGKEAVGWMSKLEIHVTEPKAPTVKEPLPNPPIEPNEGTQHANILKFMRSRSKGITVEQALLEFDIQSLPKRISELRKMGWVIKSLQNTHPTKENVRYAKYVLDVEAHG